MENIRLLVQEEGRTARNLVAFHVPIDVTLPNTGKSWTRKPPALPRSINDTKKTSTARQGQRMMDVANPVKRIRSASTGRDKKSELQARYWAYLFGNLERAVNEIYSTCETDESVTECKEAILVLENYTREFQSLIDWFQIKSAYENTAAPQRPTSLTWDVRKSSPGKIRPGETKIDPSTLTKAADLTSKFDDTSDNSSENEVTISKPAQLVVAQSPDSNSSLANAFSSSERSNPQEGNMETEAIPVTNIQSVDEVGCEKNIVLDQKESIGGNMDVPLENVQSLISNEMSKISQEENTARDLKDVFLVNEKEEPKDMCNEKVSAPDPCNENTSVLDPPDVPVTKMINEASQTDLELCVQDADGIRFIAPPSAKVANKPVRSAVTPRKAPPPNYAAVSRLGATRFSRPAPVIPPQRAMPRSQPSKQQINSLASRYHLTKSAPTRSSVQSPPMARPVLDRHSQCSLSSSSTSVRSWADKVRHDSANFNQSTVSVEVLPRTGTANQDDDQQGWETVKGRSRSRWPPSTTSKAKLRFNQLSASSSLPALALSEVEVCLPRSVQKKTVTHDAKRNKEKENTREKRKSEANVKAIEESVEQKLSGNEAEDNVLDSNVEIFEDILAEELRVSQELSVQEARLRQEILELEAEEQTKSEPSETLALDDDNLEARYENVLSGMSWAERMDTLEQLQEYVARNPGRATELHQKLSSPSRRRTVPETLRRFQSKQALAKEKREELGRQRTARLKELHNKVEEVKAAQEENTAKRKLLLDTKLKRAEANRQQHLKGIVKKAHDEDQKLKEIAFITELETQNKRHDFMALCQEQEDRLQGIAEERQRKQEEKAAKEAAVEERRRVLEAERQEKLERMQELRREREERVGRAQQEKEKERQELAREKARDREERLSALHAAQLATQEELQKKIRVKQEESARRHEEMMEIIRQRALESSILRTDDAAPWLAPYQVLKLCEICNVLIGSEVYLLSHLRGRNHQEAVQKIQEGAAREEIAVLNIRHIVDAPAEKLDPRLAQDKKRQVALKKRCKKIRQRMSQRGQEFEAGLEAIVPADTPAKQRLAKSLRDLDKLFKAQGKGQWPNPAITSLERALGEINRILAKAGSVRDQEVFRALGGFLSVTNIIGLGLDVPPNMASYLPTKCFVTACTTLTLACQGHPVNARYLLLSNKISTVLDLLLSRLSVLIPEVPGSSPGSLTVDALGDALMRLLALVLSVATPGDDLKAELFSGRVQDVISYTVSVGVVDKLALYCGGVRDPITEASASQSLLSGLELLSTLTARCVVAGGKAGGRDPTQLLVTLQVTELVGAVSMLYGMLLHQGGPPRNTPPPPLPRHVVQVALATAHLLTRIAELDLDVFQSVLGAEGISLQFRHIASYLLWYCSHMKDDDHLLHAVVKLVGFFAVNHRDNQMMLQSGYMPTVLQQLCNLPLPYFVNTSLSAILFPTLLACCVANAENRAILEQEISYQSLEEFRTSEVAQGNKLMQILAAV